jgi:hypothetical protein
VQLESDEQPANESLQAAQLKSGVRCRRTRVAGVANTVGGDAGMVRIVSYVDAEMSAGPMPVDCERIGDAGLGWPISIGE